MLLPALPACCCAAWCWGSLVLQGFYDLSFVDLHKQLQLSKPSVCLYRVLQSDSITVVLQSCSFQSESATQFTKCLAVSVLIRQVHMIRHICNVTFKWAGGGSPLINWEGDFAPTLAHPWLYINHSTFAKSLCIIVQLNLLQNI